MRAHATLPSVDLAHVHVPATDSSPSETTQYNGNVMDIDIGRHVFTVCGFVLRATREDGRGRIKSSYDNIRGEGINY
jgi:hypothetical protein